MRFRRNVAFSQMPRVFSVVLVTRGVGEPRLAVHPLELVNLDDEFNLLCQSRVVRVHARARPLPRCDRPALEQRLVPRVEAGVVRVMRALLQDERSLGDVTSTFVQSWIGMSSSPVWPGSAAIICEFASVAIG